MKTPAGVAWTAANPLAMWEGKLDGLRAAFGPSWTWHDIAGWTVARANAEPKLPAWQVMWAREFMDTHRRQASDDEAA